MSAWTKGPWHVDPDDRPDMEYNNHICNEYGTICFMAHNEPACQDEFDAAARLIAAAPDMAEALEKLLDPSTDMLAHSVNVIKARAALAKARGGG